MHSWLHTQLQEGALWGRLITYVEIGAYVIDNAYALQNASVIQIAYALNIAYAILEKFIGL